MPWFDNPLTKAAVPLAPDTVLQALAAVAKDDLRPVLTLRLSSGHALSGGLVTLGADRHSDVVVLRDPHSEALTYTSVSAVVAVEVHNPESFQDVLTGGRVSLPYNGEPVTRLALQREFASVEGFPVEVDWSALDGSGAMLGNMAVLLRGLRDAVAVLSGDDMGREAWARVRTLRVEHQAGSPLNVRPIADGLAVHADLSAALPRTLPSILAAELNTLF